MNLSSLNTAIATGRNGRFRGLESDKAVFGAYRSDGVWSTDVTHFFSVWFDGWAQAGLRGTYLDIGANIGLTLVPLARHNQVATAIGIEADPTNAALLRHNLELNGLDDNMVIEAAVYDHEAVLELERGGENAGDHRLRRDPRADALTLMDEAARQTVNVRAAPLDDLLADLHMQGPLAIKVDIQGAEPALFRGGTETAKRAEVMLIEYWPYGMARMGEDEAAFRANLQSMFTRGALIWPHAPTDAPVWQSLDDIFSQVDGIFGGGDTELHKIGCLNLALRH